MGYLHDQQGIIRRYLREHSNWKNHLDRTRSFIESSFPLQGGPSKPKASVAVLGSGWLLDVPLEHLMQVFGKVYLVDVFHPPQIRKKAGKLNNVMLVEEDLSGGGIEQVWNFSSGKGPASPTDLVKSLQLKLPLADLAPSAFISLNLMNQLDILLCDYLIKHSRVEENLLDQLRSKIQSFHLHWITKKPGCLITDTMEISIHKDGREEQKPLLFSSLPEGQRREKWTWEFDSAGNYRAGVRSRMEVEGVCWT